MYTKFAAGRAHVVFVLGKRHELHAVFARLRLVGFQIERPNAETLLRMAEREGAAQNGQAHLLFSIHVIDQQIWAIGGIAEPRKHERCIRHETRHAGESFHKWRHRRAAKLSAFDNSANAAQARLRIRGETEGAHARSCAKEKADHPERRPKGYALWHTRKNSDAMRDKKARGVGPYAPFAIMRFASTPIIESAAPSAGI